MNTNQIVGTTTMVLVLLISLVVLGLWGCPKYKVYQQRKEGEAMLAHAQSSREVAVAEAKAKMEAATMLAQADTIRAHGIARSNQIIGQSLTAAYLHWFWIDNIDKSNNVIYVPTESNLPIMEAGRLNGKLLVSDTVALNHKVE
jgi:predicted aminopeptidase